MSISRNKQKKIPFLKIYPNKKDIFSLFLWKKIQIHFGVTGIGENTFVLNDSHMLSLFLHFRYSLF